MAPPRVIVFGNCNLPPEQLHTISPHRLEISPVPANYPPDRLDYLAPFQLVLLNATVEPKEADLELIRALRQAIGTKPLILAADKTSPDFLVQAYRYGLTDCLLAPFTDDQTVDVLSGYLEKPEPKPRHELFHLIPDWMQEQWAPVQVRKDADLSACLLGTFRLYRKGERLDLPGGVRQRSLLAYLMYFGGKKMHRDKIIRWFWPDHDPDCARNNLNVAICTLRKFLEKHFKQEVICFENGYFFIHPDLKLHRDTDDFFQAFSQGKHQESHGYNSKAVQWFQLAAQMGSEFLEEFPMEDWTIRPREEFTEKFFHALDALSTHQQESRQFDEALDTLRTMLYKDDCLESVHNKMMACYLAQGKNEMAVRQYYECERILQEKLKMRPSQETEALFDTARGVHSITSLVTAHKN